MTKRRTTATFKQEVFLLAGDEYTVLGEYKSSNTKILMKHNLCGNEWFVIPNNFLKGSRCPKEGNNIKKTTEQFKQEVYNLVKDEYIVLEKYESNKKEILIRHTACGNEYKVRPESFLKGNRCPKCRWNVKKSTDTFKKDVYKLVKDEYTVMGEYEGANKNILIKHELCGHKWSVKPSNFLFGGRCPICSHKIACNKKKKTHEQFIKEVYELVGDEYTAVSKYEYALVKLKMKHNKCGTEYEVKPADFLSGYRCPHCCESHGEKAISKYLRKNKIHYRGQYKIRECRNKNPLPFDFAIFNKSELLALIEYDGEQHFNPITYFGGIETFDYIKRNDNIKTRYCLSNGIPLIRVSYTIDNIEEYLEKEISKLN